MKTTLGDDWQDLFDIVLANCRLPLFATTEQKFRQFEDRERGDIVEVADMHSAQERIFLEGNAKTLSEYFGDAKIAYLGSKCLEELHSFTNLNWHLIHVGGESDPSEIWAKSAETSYFVDSLSRVICHTIRSISHIGDLIT
jgi:hypothetical protein